MTSVPTNLSPTRLTETFSSNSSIPKLFAFRARSREMSSAEWMIHRYESTESSLRRLCDLFLLFSIPPNQINSLGAVFAFPRESNPSKSTDEDYEIANEARTHDAANTTEAISAGQAWHQCKEEDNTKSCQKENETKWWRDRVFWGLDGC